MALEEKAKEEQDKTLQDDLEDKAKKEIKKGIKYAITAILSAIGSAILPIIIIAIIVATIIAALFGILDETGNNSVADVASKSVIAEQVEIEKSQDGDYYFKITNTIIDEYLKELNRAVENGYFHNSEGNGKNIEKEDYKYNAETAEITRADLEDIFGTENFEAYLVKMIRAEIASSYPKLSDYVGDDIDDIGATAERHRKQKNKVDTRGNFVGQGMVKIKRTPISEDGTVGEEKELKYIPYESEKEGEQTFKGMIEAQNMDALNYYSFDGDVVYYATYSTTGEGTRLTPEPIQYKSVASMCSMPFNFLFSLLQKSKNPEWIMAVCDLVLEQQQDREVVIMIQDQLTRTVTTETYYSVIMTEKQGYIVDEFGRVLADGQTSYYRELGNPEVRQTVTIQNTANVFIKEANTWCLDFEQTSTVTGKENHSSTDSNISTSDATFGEPTFDSGGMNTDVAGTYETTRTSTSTEKYLGNTTIDTTTYTVEVQSGDKEINHDQFLGLWKNEKGEIYEGYKFEKDGKLVGYTMEKGGKRYPPKDISEKNEQRIDGVIELLTKHGDTETQEQLMKYFWNVYMGRDIYEVDVDSILNLFNTKITKSISGMSGMNLLRKYILSFEGSTTVSPDGTKYRIDRDPVSGTLAVGHGVDLEAGGHKIDLINAGYSGVEGEWVDKEFADSLCDDLIEEHLGYAKSYTSGLNLEEYQLHALACRSYQAGPGGLGAYEDYGLDRPFKDYYIDYWKEEDNRFDGIQTEPDWAHTIYTHYMDRPTNGGVAGLIKRRKSEWTLFQTGYYDRLGVWYSQGATQAVEEALTHIGQGYAEFGLAGHWCAQFVSYCFQKAGLIPDVLPEPFTGCTTEVRKLRAAREIYRKDIRLYTKSWRYNILQLE